MSEGVGGTGEDAPEEPFEHQPVMVEEVVDLFRPVPPGPLVDATVGGGGHSRALLDALPHVHLVGLDRAADALAAAERTLRPYSGRVALRHASFDRITDICEELGLGLVSGVLFDLGVSSPQLDRAGRGFSYGGDGPLDMRMDRSQARTAADVVNGYTEDELARVLRSFGDERHARRIARAVVAARPLHSTGELAEVIRAAIPAPARRRGGHPARRSFQAIRIEVNRELAVLPAALDQALELLVPGGRCAALAYHSGEDRIVKARFVEADTGGCQCPPGLPCACGAVPEARLLWRGARRPTPEE
ncbi:MAG TPA: 16S rRNA (cytosine(1402)-N(4))-methyltransferase RsmH, partial [Acidimicrobiales bacterium]|nr:16S rRNA (cytosine(1402)-N(4))-methyltransferase RsmH [Acidimicrobiales bacterium]